MLTQQKRGTSFLDLSSHLRQLHLTLPFAFEDPRQLRHRLQRGRRAFQDSGVRQRRQCTREQGAGTGRHSTGASEGLDPEKVRKEVSFADQVRTTFQQVSEMEGWAGP